MSSELTDALSQTVSEDSAAVAVIIRDENILLGLREYSPKKGGANVWTAPGGSVDAGETLEMAVRRETREETGIDDLVFVDYIGKVNAKDRDPLFVFRCETNQEPELAEPDKFGELRWFPVAKFVRGQPDNYINEASRELILDYCQKNGIID